MGMFDYIRFENGYPDLCIGKEKYQTKDTDEQYLENYKITKDGKLMLQKYDTKWIKDKSAIFGVYQERSNPRWINQTFTGAINIIDDREYCIFFEKGKLLKVVETNEKEVKK